MSLRNPGARFVSGPSRCFRRRRRPAWKGLLVVVGVCAAAVCEARPPNVVLILADDVGYGDLGVYGHPYARTPSLDRLAREGTRFTHFYVGGFTCNPSRTAFMTGRYPARYENRTDNNGFGNWMTISEALANQGYSTAHFGKWHIGPMKRDGTYGIGEIRTPAGSRSDPEGRDAAIFAAAIEFIERHRDSPFYVNIWGRIAHSPINPPPRLYRRFPDFDFDRNDFGKWAQVNFDRSQSLIDRYGLSEDLATAMRKYESEIGALDSQVGGLLDRLAELGLSHNTIVIFTSDQGAEPVFRSESELTEDVERPNVRKNLLGYAGGLRGSKHTVYEGGVRAPLIVRWPKKIPAGVVNRTSVISATDLLPTLARIAGADIDAEHSAELDGEDISDIWFGSRRSRSQPIFWRISDPHGAVTVRSGDWKLTRTDGGHELFNIAADPFEQNDLAASRRDVVDLLDSSISDWVETLPTAYQFERSRSPQRPRARAGSDRTVRDEDGDGRVWIRLDATRSRDPDGAISGYVWKVGGKRLGVGRSPLVSLAIGNHSITLIVTDYANRRSRDRLRVSVVR